MAEYIEREAAVEAICDSKDEDINSFNPITKYNAIYYAIEAVPAADVVEVVHARWDENGRCTNCGGHAPYYSMASTYYKSPYCFECGAKMSGERRSER